MNGVSTSQNGIATKKLSDRKGTEFIQPKITVHLLFEVNSYTIIYDPNWFFFTMSLCTLLKDTLNYLTSDSYLDLLIVTPKVVFD